MDALDEFRQTFDRIPGVSKYGNVKVQIDGITFDSKAEGARYRELMLLFKGGVIRNLELQPKFTITLNGKKVFTYKADFSYFEKDQRVVEDVKGFRTPVYKLKKRIVEAQLGVTIKEITA